MQPTIGRVVRNGKLQCLLLSSGDLQQYDPNLAGHTAFFCGPDPFDGFMGGVFVNGTMVRDCFVKSTGACAMATECDLGTVPVCPFP
jgi:hypothetical protein